MRNTNECCINKATTFFHLQRLISTFCRGLQGTLFEQLLQELYLKQQRFVNEQRLALSP